VGLKKVLVSRYGAYGDQIVISFLPRLLKDQGFDVVDFEVNHKGFQVLGNNPFIDNLRCWEPPLNLTGKEIEKRWEEISQGYDKFINLYGSLEIGCIAMESDALYYESSEVRRKELGNINFYDQTCAWAGYPELCGKYKPELYFTDEEIKKTERWLRQFGNSFIVLINLSGTSKHKRFVQAKEVTENILNRYPEAQVILTGDNQELVFTGKRITSIVGVMPFMQAALIAKYVDCVIAMESGLGIAGNVWGTPTVFLLTASSPASVTKYADNDLCLQSPAPCSPCHRGPYAYRGCQMENDLPVCVNFKIDDIMDRIGIAHSIYLAKHED
jgi:ADP-heptose:LPS heptosyltransferase